MITIVNLLVNCSLQSHGQRLFPGPFSIPTQAGLLYAYDPVYKGFASAGFVANALVCWLPPVAFRPLDTGGCAVKRKRTLKAFENRVAFGSAMSSSLSVWSSLRFRRARGLSCGFVLSGVPVSAFAGVAARLRSLGGVFVSCGSSLSARLCWVCFTCSRLVAGHLALSVPCAGLPLLVAESGGVLSGAAESVVLRALASGCPLVRVSRQLVV